MQAEQDSRKRAATPSDISGPSHAKQATLEASFSKGRPLEADSTRSLEITRHIGRFIAMDNQPFTVVEDKGFKDLIHYLEPRYTIPHGTYFSNTHSKFVQRSES